MQTDLSDLVAAALAGDKQANNRLAEYFLPKALAIARSRFPVSPSPIADQEDIANSALNSLCEGIQSGQINYRGDEQLLGALKKIIIRKGGKYWRIESADKRNKGKAASEIRLYATERILPLEQLSNLDFGEQIVADSSINLTDTERAMALRILIGLGEALKGVFINLVNHLSPDGRTVLLRILEKDVTNQQLAKDLNCSVPTIERHRRAIREFLDSRSEN